MIKIKNDKNKIIAVKFNTTSPEYKTKQYYYKTDKRVIKGQEIIVPVENNQKASAIVSNSNVKSKITRKLKNY